MKNNFLKVKYLINFDNYISKKNTNLLLLISFLAILPFIFSSYQSTNLWERFVVILQDSFANFLFFIEIFIIILNIKRYICYNELFYMRFSSSKDLVLCGLKVVFIAVLLFYLIFSLFALAGSSFFSLENYSFGMYEKYNINISFYILFLLVKNTIIYILVASSIYLMSFIIKKNIIKYILSFIGCALYFVPYEEFAIKHLYKVPILFQDYLLGIDCSSFLIETIITLIYIFVIVVIGFILYKISIKRRYCKE